MRKKAALLLAIILILTAIPATAEYNTGDATHTPASITDNAITTPQALHLPQPQVTPLNTETTLTISSTNIRPGGTATVTLNITNNPGFSNMILRIEHPSQLTLTAHQCQLYSQHQIPYAFFSNIIPRNGYFYAGWTHPSGNIEANGTLLTLTFAANTTALIGETLPITATVSSREGADTVHNINGDILPITITSGELTVMQRIGDLNGDGRITSADANMLARYLIGTLPQNQIPPREIMDINCDGEVNTLDLTTLVLWLMGHIDNPCIHGGCHRCDPSIPDPGNGNGTDVQIGDTIQFGGTNWLVLDICETTNHAKILRERVIANQLYHHTGGEVTWETSSSRAWLNNDFYNSLPATDRARIRETYVINNDNPWTYYYQGTGHFNHTPGGNNTWDRIFLLSIEEVAEYFGGSELLELGRDENNRLVCCCDGENAPFPGLYSWGLWENNEVSNTRIALNDAGSASWWWLRSPGSDSGDAAAVLVDGTLLVGGDPVDYDARCCCNPDGGGLRPALWLNLES